MNRTCLSITLALSLITAGPAMSDDKQFRIRDLGLTPGIFPTGKFNAITDVSGVKVGHQTLIEGDAVRTGVTAVLPHDGNLFREKVPAAERVDYGDPEAARERARLNNSQMSALFLGVVEATEEAIYNALVRADTMTGRNGHTARALPLDEVKRLAGERRAGE